MIIMQAAALTERIEKSTEILNSENEELCEKSIYGDISELLIEQGVEIPLTEDDLPYDDGMPMETQRHVLQMNLLIDSLALHWSDRDDFFVGGNMFVYYSMEQVRRKDFIGPDVFVVTGVPRREHKSWVVWQEGKGPDVVIELLSVSTALYDKTLKKQIYQDKVRVS